MTLYYDNIKDIIRLTDKQYKHIKLIKHSDTTLHFELDSPHVESLVCYPIKIITDFDKYCMAESALDSIDLNLFNMMIALKDKSPKNIIDEISKIIKFHQNVKLKSNSFMDPFHIFQTIEENTKYSIDYSKLEKELLKRTEMNKSNKSGVNIPKSLLLSPNQICQLVINEIKKVNRNRTFEHYICIDINNPFTLNIRFIFNSGPIGTLFQEINKKYGYNYMEIKLSLDSIGYPFIPPKLEYVKPSIKMPLLLSLLNLDILKLENWNSTIELEYFIIKLGEQLNAISVDYINIMNPHDDGNKLLEYELIRLTSITKESSLDKMLINISVPKINTTKSANSSGKFWKSGTGYGSEGVVNWDITKYIKEQELLNDELSDCLTKICTMITNDNIGIISDSLLMNYIIKQISGLNMLELEKNRNIWQPIFNILSTFIGKPLNQSTINMIASSLKTFFEELQQTCELLIKEPASNNEFIIQLYCLIDYYMTRYIAPPKVIEVPKNIKEEYCMVMKKLQFGSAELTNSHRFIQFKSNKPEQKALMRMLSEVSSFKNNLPLNWESSIWVRVPKDNLNLFSFMISGPKDTPYENGLFEFHAYLPPDYPTGVPQVLLHTTGNNTIRFNPNLYNSGKVCLSLLGTWQGQEGEKWNAKTSTFLQVLVSIQSLILVEQPFFNEPGYEREINTPVGKKKSDDYNEEKEPHTINLAMIDMIRNPPKGYEEIVMNHFRMKKDEIITKTLIWEQRATKHNVLISTYRKELISLLNNM